MVCKCSDQYASNFIAAAFTQCIAGTKMTVSFVFGWLSIICWIVCYVPQIRMSFLLKKGEAMSLFFLICWITGDIFNMASCFLLDQLFTQKLLGIIYCVCDSVLIFQYFYYKKANKPQTVKSTKVSFGEIMVYVFITVVVLNNIVWAGVHGDTQLTFNTAAFQPCPESTELSKGRLIAGDVIAYLSIPGYCLSRPGQIVKNCRRKTTNGLSLGMFSLIVFANLTQIVSLITGSPKSEDLVRKIPYLIGAIWPCLCDVFILSQFMVFDICKKKTAHADSPIELRESTIVSDTMDPSTVLDKDGTSHMSE